MPHPNLAHWIEARVREVSQLTLAQLARTVAKSTVRPFNWRHPKPAATLSVVMPYEVRIDSNSRTIVVKGFGKGTTAETLQLIASQRETFRAHPGFNLLYDSSRLEIESSPADLMKVAEALFDNGAGAFGRIAIVVPHSREALARIFTALAHPYGVAANVFLHENDAWTWLGVRQ